MSLWAAWSVEAQLPTTQLRSLYPPVVQVGASGPLEITGSGPLEEVERLIFSHPGISANLVAGQSDPLTGEIQKVFGKFTLSVSSDTPPGFYEGWAIGRHGASYPRVMWVSPRPVVSAPQPANESGPYPALAFDNVVVDRFVAARVQRYELPLAAGSRTRVTVLDARLDSRALSHLRAISPAGQLIRSARSEGTSGAAVEFIADQAGTYRLELRDGVYRGGEEFFYAIFVESLDTPRIDPTPTMPIASREQLLAALEPHPSALSPARLLAALALPRWISSEGTFLAAPTQSEPIDVTPPCMAHGAFSDHPAGHQFQLTAKKGDAYWLDVASDSLGENSDPHLAVYKVTNVDGAVKLARIAEQDDAPALGSPPFRIIRRDPSLRWEVPEDGTYRIVVRDQLATNRTTAGRSFVLAVRKPQPAIDVLAAWAFPTNNQAQARPIGANLLVGGTVAIRVIVARADGLSGAVEVRCEGLPAGVTAPSILIPADRDEGHLIISCPAQVPAAAVPLKIIGRVVGDASPGLEAVARAAALTWEPIPSWNSLTGRLSEQLMLYVNDKDAQPVSFQVGGESPLVMARGGKLPIPINVTRRPGGADKAVLRAQGLPSKTTLADTTIEGNANEAKPELVVAADAPTGEATFWMQAETKVKFRNNPQALERAEARKVALEKIVADPARTADKDAATAALKQATDTVNQLKDPTAEKDVAVFLPTNTVRIKIIEAPLEPASAWKIECKRGTESDHALPIKRLIGFDGAVDLQLVSDAAAAGVQLKAPSLATGSDQTQVHVAIAADAAAGQRDLKLKVVYKFNGQDLSVNWPLTLTITE